LSITRVAEARKLRAFLANGFHKLRKREKHSCTKVALHFCFARRIPP